MKELAAIIITHKEPRQYFRKLKADLNKKIRLTDKQIIEISNANNNIGFPAAVNKGIKKAIAQNYSLFLILNPDLRMTKLSIKEIRNSLKHFDIFGGVLIQNDHHYYKGVVDKTYLSGSFSQEKPNQTYIPSDFVSGSCMFIKKRAVEKIGYMYEPYFLYYDDVDYCYRARQKNFRVGINQNISYQHAELSTTIIPKKEYYLSRSHLMFLSQYGNFKQKIRMGFKLIFQISSLLLKSDQKSKQKLSGILDFLKHKHGP